jgi:hypothetical protein
LSCIWKICLVCCLQCNLGKEPCILQIDFCFQLEQGVKYSSGHHHPDSMAVYLAGLVTLILFLKKESLWSISVHLSISLEFHLEMSYAFTQSPTIKLTALMLPWRFLVTITVSKFSEIILLTVDIFKLLVSAGIKQCAAHVLVIVAAMLYPSEHCFTHNNYCLFRGVKAWCPIPKLNGHALLVVCDCLFGTCVFTGAFISEGCLIHPHPENIPCYCDKMDPLKHGWFWLNSALALIKMEI